MTEGLSDYDKEHIEDLIFGEGDWFSAKLIRLCVKADGMNLERLRKGFPDHVEAYEAWKKGKGV